MSEFDTNDNNIEDEEFEDSPYDTQSTSFIDELNKKYKEEAEIRKQKEYEKDFEKIREPTIITLLKKLFAFIVFFFVFMWLMKLGLYKYFV